MHLDTLAQTSVADITTAFNKSFSNYFIPLQLTNEGMAKKIRGEGIVLSYSIGAFEGGQLVGFILHGHDVVGNRKTIYNAGTGVVPEHRGKGLTAAMYQYAIPLLQKQGTTHHLLEVIDKNHVAFNVYEKTGFTTARSLQVYKSTQAIAAQPVADIKDLESIPPEAKTFSTIEAAWQNSLASIQRDIESHRLIGAFLNETMVGFAAFVPETGRVKQCSVHAGYRRRGIGRQLFQYMQQQSASGELVVTHVEEGYEPAALLLQSLGFTSFLRLYEMKMDVRQ